MRSSSSRGMVRRGTAIHRPAGDEPSPPSTVLMTVKSTGCVTEEYRNLGVLKHSSHQSTADDHLGMGTPWGDFPGKGGRDKRWKQRQSRLS